MNVHYSGIGKINAAFRCTEVILKFKPDLIVNLGTAGSPRIEPHSVVECETFVQRDMDLTSVGGKLGETPFDETPGKIQVPVRTDLRKVICGTGDKVEMGQPVLNCDIVDMEAYAFAKVCHKLSIPFASIKYISDKSDTQTSHDWRKNLQRASLVLLEAYNKYFNKCAR